MSTAHRSCDVTFVNSSDVALLYDSEDVKWGEWSPRFLHPPARMEPGETMQWGSESRAVFGLTGTEVVLFYRIELPGGFHGGYLRMWWNIPQEGSRKYDQQSPPAYKWALTGELNSKNAVIQWEFMEASTAGDGIPDDWKMNGVTRDGQFIDLPAMGATIDRPNIFLQIDWMEDSNHDHRVSDAALKTVAEAFDRSPYVSRSGSVGINLIIDHGFNSVMKYGKNGDPDVTWGALTKAHFVPEEEHFGTGDYSWTAFDAEKNRPSRFTKSGRSLVFRYCISAHLLSAAMNPPDVSGVARRSGEFDGGSDMIIADGAFNPPATDLEMAGTIMHELGHLLSLNHGGGDPGQNFKPNFLSVMNYHFQLTGLTRAQAVAPGSPPVPVTGIIDYSREALQRLQEDALDEQDGIGTRAAGLGTVWFDASVGAFVPIFDGNQPINWNNQNGFDFHNVSYNIRHDGSATGPPPAGTLNGWNDWEHIRFKGGLVGRAGGPGSAIVLPGAAKGTETHSVNFIRTNRLPDDITPPVTTASVYPSVNAAGWHNTQVTVRLDATDDITGVAKTEYSTDGGATWSNWTGPTVYTMEGTFNITYRSVDRVGNVEAPKTLTLKIDRTPPGILIEYEPRNHFLRITAEDPLSGVPNTQPISPAAREDIFWTSSGSDPAQRLAYVVSDYADNESLIFVNLRSEPDEYELSVLQVQHPRDKNGKPDGEMVRNSVVYRRRRGWDDKERPLLAVFEQIALGEGEERTVERRAWDVLHDDTQAVKWMGNPKFEVGYGQRRNGKHRMGLRVGPRGVLEVVGV